ncbi:hypothetical protein NBRC111894_518 [Sporolactobacillus inulinus]|uniref:Uncharacterized protein n=1 Tax=Sporolactobacillus inulinus TaxID=2078 RepID=A0A4Y1Z7J9_9BACL|nr:hypothetical protein NBRC111894_518 [Sporolactobacillus inulinus]
MLWRLRDLALLMRDSEIPQINCVSEEAPRCKRSHAVDASS